MYYHVVEHKGKPYLHKRWGLFDFPLNRNESSEWLTDNETDYNMTAQQIAALNQDHFTVTS